MNSATVPAGPAVVRAAMLDGRGRRSFLADVVIEHGPRDVLGRLFLKADTALREKGIFVSFADYDELRAANKANADSWSPLLPVFDPAQGGYRRVSSVFSPYRADLDHADDVVELDRDRLMAALAAFFRGRQLSTDWDAVNKAADANLVTSLSMVLPFGPAEKQALLEAADSTARAKLLIAFLEMSAFGDPSDTPPGRTN